MPPALVGDCASSPASTELLDSEPFLRGFVGGGRRTAARVSDPGLSNESEDEWLSPPLLLPAMKPVAAPAAAAPAESPRLDPPCLEGGWPECPSNADIRAILPPGSTSNP